MAFDQPLNIFRVPGASLVAFVPQQLHGPGDFTFSMAVVNGTANPRAARALIAYLRTPASVAAIRQRGMDPG